MRFKLIHKLTEVLFKIHPRTAEKEKTYFRKNSGITIVEIIIRKWNFFTGIIGKNVTHEGRKLSKDK